MAETTYSRKLDTSGRIMIPVKLREQLGLKIGKEYTFSVEERDGRKCLVIDCGPDDELAHAIEVVRRNGLVILPEE